MSPRRTTLGLLLALLLWPMLAPAATVDDFVDAEWRTQALRFLSFEDGLVRTVVFGTAGLGLACGLMGCFILVRKQALLGDTLSHAVLPGVALGFLWSLTKDPLAIFVGAVAAGLFSAALTVWIRQTTLLKDDTALGLVLGGFYGVGIVLVRVAQNQPGAQSAGLDKFFFGQAAALGQADVVLIWAVAGLAAVLVMAFYKELLTLSFDLGYARSLGLPVGVLNALVMLLLAFAVVVSLQAVGIVLVSALLIAPAATAYLLTDRLHRMLPLAAGFGILAGVGGAFISFLNTGLPTGPFIVLVACGLFAAVFLGAPQHGLLARFRRRYRLRQRIGLENTLKAIFQVREAEGFAAEAVALSALAERRRQRVEEVRASLRPLQRAGLAVVDAPAGSIRLTAEGWEHACRVVRNHRLWELYLANAAAFPLDHVHEDAEVIEHVLGEDTVRQLEARLGHPSTDPHGRSIPSVPVT